MLTETDKAYLAGYVDGEGCININTNSNGISITPRLQVASVELAVLLIFYRTYGGSISTYHTKTHKHRDYHTWCITKQDGFTHCLIDILPFLKIKWAQANLALELMHHTKATGNPGCKGVSPSTLEFRQRVKTEMHQLNQTGKRKEA